MTGEVGEVKGQRKRRHEKYGGGGRGSEIKESFSRHFEFKTLGGTE